MAKIGSKKIIIVLTLAITFLLNSVFAFNVSADANELFTQGKLTKLAKGIAALYLLNKANSFLTGQRNNIQKIEERQSVVDKADVVRRLNDKIIVIDPGHGGYDPGAVGPEGLKEKDVALAVALKLYDLLKTNTGARVYLTREDDQFVSLSQRAAMANDLGADIFISIHLNGDEKGLERGTETYAHYGAPRETWALAWYIQESLVKELGFMDRGLKADNFQILREANSNMKAVLLEIGFITTAAEEAYFREKESVGQIARAIMQGILTYLNNV